MTCELRVVFVDTHSFSSAGSSHTFPNTCVPCLSLESHLQHSALLHTWYSAPVVMKMMMRRVLPSLCPEDTPPPLQKPLSTQIRTRLYAISQRNYGYYHASGDWSCSWNNLTFTYGPPTEPATKSARCITMRTSRTDHRRTGSDPNQQMNRIQQNRSHRWTGTEPTEIIQTDQIEETEPIA